MVSPAFPSPLPPLENIALIEKDQKTLVTSASADTSFEPFELPLIQQSQCQWMMQLCHNFNVRHQRCLALMLLMDCQTHQWGCCIPPQRASHDASCFWASRAELPEYPPSVRIAGSFQSRVLADQESPADAVPASEGLHLVLQIQQDPISLIGFLRIQELVKPVLPSQVIFDDLMAALARCTDRVQLL